MNTKEKIYTAILVATAGFACWTNGRSYGFNEMKEISDPILEINEDLGNTCEELSDAYLDSTKFIKNYVTTDQDNAVAMRERKSELEANLKKQEEMLSKINERRDKLNGLIEKSKK